MEARGYSDVLRPLSKFHAPLPERNLNDPLDFGLIQLRESEIPKLTAGEKIFEELYRLSDENKKVSL